MTVKVKKSISNEVQKFTRLISIIMLLVFTLLVVKVFFADLLPHGSGDEFAHIHTVKINKIQIDSAKTWTALEDVCHGTNGFVFFCRPNPVVCICEGELPIKL